jgi:uncharacterized protein (TIGR03083 family)
VTDQAVDAFASERAVALDVLAGLTDDQWAAPSGCEGWSVHDVAIHMVSSLQLVADPEHAEFPDPALGTEEGLDAIVAARREWTPAETLARYEDVSAKAIEAFRGLQADGIRDTELDMGGLGSHPMHLIANAYAFDLYTHLRVDLLAPRGPLTRSLPPPDDSVLGATVEWLLAGLPQMCTPALRPVVTAPLALTLTGPGGGTWTIAPTGDPARACAVVEGTSHGAAATVTSTTADFVWWSTKRADWRGRATVEGDDAYAAAALDAVNLI